MRRGIVASSWVAPPPPGVLRSYAKIDTTLTTYTFSGVDIGPSNANRTIVVAVSGYTNSNRTVSSVSIGGVPAIISNQSPQTWYPVANAYAHIPNGSVADIIVTFSNPVTFAHIYVWSFEDRVVNMCGNGGFGNPVNITGPVVKGSTVLGVASTTALTTPSFSPMTTSINQDSSRRTHTLRQDPNFSGLNTVKPVPDAQASLTFTSFGTPVPTNIANADIWTVAEITSLTIADNANLYLYDYVTNSNLTPVIYALNAKNTLNGFGTAKFNGSTSAYLGGSLTQLDPQQTYVFVVKPNDSASLRVLAKRTATGYAFGLNASNEWYIEFDGVPTLTSPASINTWSILTFVVDQNSDIQYIRVNGQVVASQTDTRSTVSSGLVQMLGYNGNNESFDGLIAEHIRYRTALSPSDISQIESYLSNKYSLAI